MLILTPRPGAAQGFELRSEPWVVRPPTALVERWIDHEYTGGQIWGFADRADLERTLSAPSLPEDLRAELRALYQTGSIPRAWTGVDPDFEAGRRLAKGYVEIGEALWGRLPLEFLNGVYQGFAKDADARLGLYLSLSAARAGVPRDEFVDTLLREIKLAAIDDASADAFLSATIVLGRQPIVLATPFAWRKFSREARRRIIETVTVRNTCSQGLRCTLTLTKENLPAVVRAFSGQEVEAVTARLTNRLTQAGGSPVELDLRKALPRSIGRRLDTFSPCAGPNCYAAGLNVGRTEELVGHVGADVAVEHLLRDYRLVPAGESRRLGDVVLLTTDTRRPWPVHAAVFVHENIVFTKNGYSKFQPYVLQDRRTNVAAYFPDGGYQELVFRRLAEEGAEGRRCEAMVTPTTPLVHVGP